MLCRVCYRAEATIHVLDRPAAGPEGCSHYCAACYERAALRSPFGWIAADEEPRPIGPPPFPLSRFTIQGLMGIAALFGIANAAAAFFLRSDLARGTPAPARAIAVRIFILANPVLAVVLGELVVIAWLRRWYADQVMGGPRAPYPKAEDRWAEATPIERTLLLLTIAWPLAFVVAVPRSILGRLAYGLDPLVGPATLVTILVAGWIFLYLGLVAVTRRR